MTRFGLPICMASAAALSVALLAPAAVSAAPPEPSGTVSARPWDPQAPTQLVIQTDGSVPIVSKDDYVDATIQLDGVTHETRIKGRGNSTWTWPKKPYKLKLDEDAALLGNRKQEDWVLLANYRDRSALRTAAAFALASQTSLAWTPRFKFVDVVLNGQSQGLYLLTEQVEQAKGRVELPDNGYLLEINERFLRDDEPGFRTARRTPVTFKDPDEVTKAQRKQVKRAVAEFEDVLYSRNFTHPTRGYRRFVDVDTFVDWYIVEEFFKNQDSNFQSSVNVTWIPGGKFGMGPVWDFDLSAGTRWQTASSPVGWHTRTGRHWISRMLEDPAFSKQVKLRWRELRPAVDQMIARVQPASVPLRPAAEADWEIWHAATPEAGHAQNFDGEVAYLTNWLGERAAWMSRNESMWGELAMTTKERDRTVWVPVRLLEPSDTVVSARYELVAGGTATRGVDFTMPDGVVHFAPGSVVRYIPVQIHADAEPEPAERLQIWLRSNDQQAIVGSPDIATVTIAASDQTVDSRIRRKGKGRFQGEGVVNGSGKGQTVKGAARAGARRVFDVRVANTGNARNQVRLRGTRSGRNAIVRWRLGGRDVTGQMLSKKGLRVRVAPGSEARLRVKVRVRPGAASGARVRATVRSIWKSDVRVVDRVGLVLKVR